MWSIWLFRNSVYNSPLCNFNILLILTKNTSITFHTFQIISKNKSSSGRGGRPKNEQLLTTIYPLKQFSCHIIVESVGSIRAVKYLYKYIYKGHDCAFIKVIDNLRKLNYNEADACIQGHRITPPEACWRLFVFEIKKTSHYF